MVMTTEVHTVQHTRVTSHVLNSRNWKIKEGKHQYFVVILQQVDNVTFARLHANVRVTLCSLSWDEDRAFLHI